MTPTGKSLHCLKSGRDLLYVAPKAVRMTARERRFDSLTEKIRETGHSEMTDQ